MPHSDREFRKNVEYQDGRPTPWGGDELLFEVVTRAAGVGIATLDRNFRTQEDLVAKLTKIAADLLATYQPATTLPSSALHTTVVSESKVFSKTKTYAEIVEVLAKLLAAGSDDGIILSDVEVKDGVRAMSRQWYVGIGEPGQTAFAPYTGNGCNPGRHPTVSKAVGAPECGQRGLRGWRIEIEALDK
ncbi:hypothetical protein QBC33DRAFT_564083 [Phialemonium atrogriseum]|uniref:Uncharacterized protein n=1 Tax=Phialemonium atrogriseum TaxID=1093897 RepID=A0AAJ0BSD6_9PEZI|nr:uncharacterized protein QBC33DRAFT_564083 [Phialemonium atrogriseum]KAK1762157.1 hypothetical protein QBC33DRAFT_564083 [Phialemonium atrogriseum]